MTQPLRLFIPAFAGPHLRTGGKYEEWRFIPAFAGTTASDWDAPECDTVHPRVRGDHGHRHRDDEPVVGSSPRSRGPRRRQGSRRVARRFIPAFAGTTPRRLRHTCRATVHPRVRGDHLHIGKSSGGWCGSSPRSRGPHVRAARLLENDRFIPAFAGTTPPSPLAAETRPVHPRVRGDHYKYGSHIGPHDGSSPRSRGPLSKHGFRQERGRFIPAFAGTTSARRRARRLRPVHPRVRGDHLVDLEAARLAAGSSPRSRGPHGHARSESDERRFIPAFAGTTHRLGRDGRRQPVHPRVRGDHEARIWRMNGAAGSSPRSRGPHPMWIKAGSDVRFIPAFAGTTRAGRTADGNRPVHPRVRGDHYPICAYSGA